MLLNKESLINDSLVYDIKKALKNRVPLSDNEIKKIRNILLSNNNLSKDRVDAEIFYFFTQLGFPRYYFSITSVEEIAKTIEVIRAYRIIGSKIFVESREKNKSISIVPADKGSIIEFEQKLETIINNNLNDNRFVEVDMHKSTGKSLNDYLNIYMVEMCDIDNNKKYEKIEEVSKFLKRKYKVEYKRNEVLNFFKSKSGKFIEKSKPDRISRYFIEYKKAKEGLQPVITLSRTTDKKEYRLMISFDRFYLNKTFSLITKIFLENGFEITRSYFSVSRDKEQSIITISLYTSTKHSIEKIKTVINDISIAIISSRTSLDKLLQDGKMSIDEVYFLDAFSEFAHQFLRTPERILDKINDMIRKDIELSYMLSEFQLKIEHEMFALKTIKEIIFSYYDISKLLYLYFKEKFSPDKKTRQYQKIRGRILKRVEQESSDIVKNIFNMGITFVDNIIKTNYFKTTKVALSFKMSPVFLDSSRFEKIPYSVIFLYGKNFKGYHIRFQEIARGGVRIVKSKTKEEYIKNSNDNFLEVYNLAYTQEKKNKDIPEGGSKGIILPYYKISDTDIIFREYIDSLLDIMMKDKRVICDYDNSSDMIFLGPDEGSAHLMDWAALYAKSRGYNYWRSFTTGKSEEIGGISHIDYGMTTTGVHEYVMQILKKFKISEKDITKVQTGGPDGDLGSNEILISHDKTIAVIDGSGVAYDPFELDRNELKRLARKRIPIINFDKSKLSSNGFVVSVNDTNLKLKEFKGFKNGMDLRNQFHSLVTAELFLPAGGRPRTIDIGNWRNMLISDNGMPRYKIIVEGANLFITQDARIKLEESGVILIKDSSANKGGVTSSSLEVLVSLVMDDKKFEELMTVKDRKVPNFRKKYIDNILNIIKINARLEFELLWNEHRLSGKPFSVLSDLISNVIVRITNIVREQKIIFGKEIEKRFLKNFIPYNLLDYYNIEEIYKRLPVVYRNSIISREIAKFILYNTGINWIDKVKEEYKVSDEIVIKGYIKAWQMIEKCVDKYKNDITLSNLLKSAIKEKCIKIIGKI